MNDKVALRCVLAFVENDALIYYAHNQSVFVNVGDVVKAGDRVTTAGRTAQNVYREWSPMHLYVTSLDVNKGNLIPRNFYNSLQAASR